ncbi:MAG: HAD-IB family hydrolase [Chitinophagaceae bacterium]|nr:MAG: HAD-IB family hydrolase [Chitinophagaceae bacterium]
MVKRIAFFDFDGTITNKDTMLALAAYKSGKPGFYAGMLRLAPSLIALKLNLLSAQRAKELFLKTFFGSMSKENFENLCHRFSENILPSLIRQDAWDAIQEHRANNDEVVIVSASAENWIAVWCEKHGLKFIGTQLVCQDNMVTGAIYGRNCNGIEKVSRIKAMFNLADYQEIYAYGDSDGDKPMLAIATHSRFRVFIS